jgi:hypothetical protein
MARRSRGRCRPSFAKDLRPSKDRGSREGRVSTDTRGPRADKNARGRNHRLSREHPAFPARWFDGLLRALLGDRALLPPSLARRGGVFASLAPASGRQDHTAWPSAKALRENLCNGPGTGPVAIPAKADQLVRRRKIRPRAVAATASRLHVRDDRETPLFMRRDARKSAADLGETQSGIFFARNLDRGDGVERAGEISFLAQGDFGR